MARVTNDLDRLTAVLTRHSSAPDWSLPLQHHMSAHLPDPIVAMGFDTNCLKHLRRDQKAANDVLAFIESEAISLIVPGQAIQEFWNNHGTFVADVENIVGEMGKLSKRVERLSSQPDHAVRLERLQSDLASLTADIQDSQNPRLLAESADLWEKLNQLANVSYVPREAFVGIGRMRFDSKTPPGFADDKKLANQLGDFFVWADFLLGILEAKLGDVVRRPGRVALVTDDQKNDWVVAGKPHPVLLGEFNTLTNRTLEVLTADALVKLARGEAVATSGTLEASSVT